MKRRLMTIACADVAGYSRLTGLDEEGTIARLKAHRRTLIDPTIARHGGRIVKTMGDGLLVVFDSPVEAVRCAVEVQFATAAHEASLPEDHRIRFRIGINLGDVVAEDGDILGQGVNVAARLETLADVGGIWVSRSVRDQVRDQIPVSFEDLGERTVHNIARPIRCYRVLFDDYTAELSERAARPRRWRLAAGAGAMLIVLLGSGLWFGRDGLRQSGTVSPASRQSDPGGLAAGTSHSAPRLSLVVLPFANLSGEPEQDYLADGLTEDLTTSLSRISDTFVIARNTAFTYKNKPVDVRQIGHDLGVRYVIQGSARRSDDLVRVSTQLIDAETGGHLWSEQFDRPRANLIDMQNEITGQIASALNVKLIDVESRRSLRERPSNPDAMDLAMRGWALADSGQNRDNNIKVRRLFEDALMIDPQTTSAIKGLGYTHVRDVLNRWSDNPGEQLQQADELINRTLALAPEDVEAYKLRAAIRRAQRRSEEAIAAAERAIALDRNAASAYTEIGWNWALLGHPEKTEAYVRQGIRLSPRDPTLVYWLLYVGVAKLHLHQDEEAIDWFQKAIAADPTFPNSYGWLAAAYAFMGREAEAREPMETWRRALPTLTLTRYKAQEQSDHPAYLAERPRIYAAWRKLGLPE